MKDLMREEIKFPVVWHYHIIVESEDTECVEALKGLLSDFDRRIRLEPGAPSGGGRYQSYRADAEVNSLEELEGLSSRLEKVRGVKFLL